jgi:type II secretion system protein N
MFAKACAWLLARIGELFYTLVVLVVCLWLLFPAATARDLLVRAVGAAVPQLQWQVRTMAVELPGVLRLGGVEGRGPGGDGEPLVRIDSLTLRPDLAALLGQRRLQAAWRAEMAGGTVQGLVQLSRSAAELRVEGTMQGVRLDDVAVVEQRLQRRMQGTAAADFTATIRRRPLALTALDATARLEEGRIDLRRPVLGHGSVPLARAAATLRLEGERLVLTDGAVESNLFTGTFAGDLRLHPDPGASLITLAGSLSPRSEFFSAAGGDSAGLQAIRSRLRDRPLPFRVSGALQDPGVHFEEFSLLFDALSKESRSP